MKKIRCSEEKIIQVLKATENGVPVCSAKSRSSVDCAV